ncbi:hypothetical protein ZHAS_00018578 [Anopheles sinensis]|uniref:Uncharacterized protein n=1 Tax=Anopheles sinensis TaxID=74873 RepID=A0A084WJB8_ANOSI|nr:hypothetical protein ZHAS_00018578 [Anopheles sinensis]
MMRCSGVICGMPAQPATIRNCHPADESPYGEMTRTIYIPEFPRRARVVLC